MIHRPDPLVPEEIDLTDYHWMPIEFRRLFSSDTWVLGSPEEKLAAFHLWCESWHQRPAGSLPADERLLAKLSNTGPRWKRLRAHALRGWVQCNDGRLYHPVVARKAMEAWERKRHSQAVSEIRAAAGRRGAEATNKRQGELYAEHLPPDGPAIAAAMPSPEVGGKEVKGKEKKGTVNGYPLPDWIDHDAWQGFVDMRKAGKHPLTKRAMELTIRDLEQLKAQGQDPNACLDQSVRRGWRGVFAVKESGPARGGDNRSAVEEFVKGSHAKH